MSHFLPIAYAAGAADPNVPNFFPELGGPGPASLGQTFSWDPTRGELLLAKFAALDPSDPGTSILSSEDLRQALVTALVHNEMNAAAAGLITMIPTDKGPGVVIGAAYQKASQNPSLPGAAEYLASYARVQAAIDATRPAPANAVPTLGAAQPVAIFVPILLLIAGIAAIAAVAYVASVFVESRSDSLSRLARCQMAADLAGKHLPVPAGMCPPEPKRGLLSGDGVTLPWGWILGGVALVGGGLYLMSALKGPQSA